LRAAKSRLSIAATFRNGRGQPMNRRISQAPITPASQAAR
jgi:hypothetical protein